MKKKDAITYKEPGLSTREVARRTSLDRGTATKYWNEYREQLQMLDSPDADIKAIQDSLLSEPKYNNREPVSAASTPPKWKQIALRRHTYFLIRLNVRVCWLFVFLTTATAAPLPFERF